MRTYRYGIKYQDIITVYHVNVKYYKYCCNSIIANFIECSMLLSFKVQTITYCRDYTTYYYYIVENVSLFNTAR